MCYIKSSLEEASKTLTSFINNAEQLEHIQTAIIYLVATLKNNGRIFSCGNGGSMCDAMHFAEELTGRFRKK